MPRICPYLERGSSRERLLAASHSARMAQVLHWMHVRTTTWKNTQLLYSTLQVERGPSVNREPHLRQVSMGFYGHLHESCLKAPSCKVTQLSPQLLLQT